MTDFINNLASKLNSLDINELISYLTSFELQRKLLPLSIASWIISAFFLGIIIFALLKTHYLQWLVLQDVTQFITRRQFGARKINKQWNKILKRLEAGVESEHKLAVIEADDMLQASLKRMGYTGDTFKERLEKLTSATLSNVEQIHEAHRLRNSIVHDPDYQLSLEEAQKAVDIYSQAFRDLQILI